MASYTRKAAAADVYRQAFGANLTSQGRGYYVTMELLAIVWGTSNLPDGSVLPPYVGEDSLLYTQRSHDFARRIMAGGDDAVRPEDLPFLRGQETEMVLRALFESLRVPIPGRRSLPDWGGQHLYPYIGELIHYDAVKRGRGRSSKANIERYTYRGAGGFVHKVLRTDPDADRLEQNRRGLARLVSDAGGPLGTLALACAGHDSAIPKEAFADKLEPETSAKASPWIELIRTGLANIVGRSEVSRAKQVEMLMHWLPYCVARYQLDVAARVLGAVPPALPVSLLQRPTPIRKLARQELDRARTTLERALALSSRVLAQGSEPERRKVLEGLATRSAWSRPSVAFFTQTMSATGALNAHTGSRHFTLKLPLLEALVCATLAPGQEIEFGEFCETVLLLGLNLVVDRRSAMSIEMISSVDSADFAQNSDQLASDLSSLGLLSEYSDATRMVHGEVA